MVHIQVTHRPSPREGDVQADIESNSRIGAKDLQYGCPKGQNY